MQTRCTNPESIKLCIYGDGRMVGVCVCVCIGFKSPVFDKFPSLGGSSGRPKNGHFGSRFEPFWGLGRPWAIWRPETMCFYVFFAPGSPKPSVFTCSWPLGARKHMFLCVFGPWGIETTCFFSMFLAPRVQKPVFGDRVFFMFFTKARKST